MTDVQQIELEDGLLDRIVNKVHRDTFGYFYLFFDQGIQRYDGKNFENVSSVQLSNINLANVKNVSSSIDGGIQFSIENSSFTIAAGTLKLVDTPNLIITPPFQINSENQSVEFDILNQQYFAEKGTIWKFQNGAKESLGLNVDLGLNCHILKKDKYGNFIAFFGYQARTTERIIVIRNDGTIADYSSLLSFNNNILDVYVDDIDNKWMVATFNGIFIFNFPQEGINNFYVYPNLQKSQFGHIVTSVNADTDRILFLKESYGLRELDSLDNVNLLFEKMPESFHQNQTMIYDEFNECFYSYSFDRIGEFELHKFDLESNAIETEIIQLRIRDLYNLDSDHLLIAGHIIFREHDDQAGQLYKYNKTTKELQKIIENIPAIRTIEFIKSTNEYWLCTEYGIYIYDSQFKFKESIISDLNSNKKYLSHPEIRVALEFHEYVIVGSFKGGVYVINKETKEIVKNISEANGLSDNAIAGLITDDDGNIWVSTFNGLTVLNDQLEIINKFYEYNGLPNREFNTNAIAKDKEGKIYLGTLNGLVRLDPKKLLERKRTHGLHLSSLEVFENNSVQTFIDLSQPIDIYNNYDSLRLNVSYPDYYKYRFDNWSTSLDLDKELQDIARLKKESITFSRIPINDYEFSFSNSSNPYSEKLELNISRDNSKIKVLVALFFLGLFLSYLFIKYRVNQLRKIEEEKTRVNIKIAELELRALQSQMNPHFIFNALGSVQYFIQTQKTEQADSYLSAFAKLMRKILESSKSKQISLQEEIELIELYVKLEKMRFEKMFDFELIVDEDIDMENPIPPMIIQPFIENAINHGLYHLKGRDGKLTIHFQYIDEFKMTCLIIDNGIGRAAANKLGTTKHKSRGLEIVKDRLHTINSQRDIKVHIQSIDLHVNNVAIGTQIEINFLYEE